MRSIVLALLLATLSTNPFVNAQRNKNSSVNSGRVAFARSTVELPTARKEESAETGTSSSSPSTRRASRMTLRESSTLPKMSNASCFFGNCTNTSPPTPSPTQYGGVAVGSSDWESTSSIDILVAALFLIAAGWLVLAIIYSILIICVVRMRARGELDVYDEHFGRVYFCPSRDGQRRGCYLPLGCLLRRHILALHQAHAQSQSVRVMSRMERRQAMEQLLGRGVSISAVEGQASAKETVSEEDHNGTDVAASEDHQGDLESFEGQEPVCSICLMEYEEHDRCLTSPTCVHRFHHECLMDWLERQNNTDCPCCREAIVPDDAVWDLVLSSRRQQRKLRRIQTTKGILTWCCCSCAPRQSSRHLDEDAHPTGSEDGDEADVDVEHGQDQPHVPAFTPVSHGPVEDLEVVQESITPVSFLHSEQDDENGRHLMTVDHDPSNALQGDLLAETSAEGSSGLVTVPDEFISEHAAKHVMIGNSEDDGAEADATLELTVINRNGGYSENEQNSP